ncbi:MAG TPA: galactokinase [Mycobacteriales bacterium]|nr:galactokinase [Mycobacteriales bacterium]
MSVAPDAAVRLLAEVAIGPAEGVWAAPGRVNLIGEHTDYNDGFVLPIAIDRSTVVAAVRRDDRTLGCWSVQRGAAPRVVIADLTAGRVDGWWAYMHGVAWALAQLGVDVPGADLVVDSDVPLGAGLSSSAALECATALALAELAGADLSDAELAAVGQRAEWEVAGTPCGIMDQTVSVSAREGHALLLDTRSLAVEHLPLDLRAAALTLLVIDTRVEHELRDGGYATRRVECEQAAHILGIRALRDATLDDIHARVAELGERTAARARHVVTENERVIAVADLLRGGAVADIGPHLLASHASLRDDFDVSARALDLAVESARGAGALGARMTGGGFGGSAIALVPVAAADEVAGAVRKAFSGAGLSAPEVFPVAPRAGARRVA